MKKTFLIILSITLNITVNGQATNKTNQSNSSLIHKTDFGKSKYDKSINWYTDIDPNDPQGSIDEFRKESFQKEWGTYINIGIGIILIFTISLIFYFNKGIVFKNKQSLFVENNGLKHKLSTILIKPNFDQTQKIDDNSETKLYWINKLTTLAIKDFELMFNDEILKTKTFDKFEILEKIQHLTNHFKSELNKNKIQYKISDDDIDYIISNAYKTVLEKIF